MSRRLVVALPVVASCLGLAAIMISCRVPQEGTSAGALFGEGAGGQSPAAKANQRCLECHIDFEEEEIVVSHQKAGVTCVRCHGHSQAHMEDEVRATKADVTFRGKAMTLFCQTCHEPAKYRKVRAHADELAKPVAKRRSCTACHGEHELVEFAPSEKAD